MNCNVVNGGAGNVHGITSEYLYDIDHRLVDQIVVSGTASLGYSRANIYAGGEYLGEDAPDSLVKTPSATASMLRITDQAGSLRSRWDLAGNMVTECTSFPYGEGYSCTGPTPPTLYTGKDRDPETGFDYFGARYYNSSMARFTSPDWSAVVAPVPYAELSNPQSLNLYTYVGNRPVSSVDPDGHEDTAEWLERNAPAIFYAQQDQVFDRTASVDQQQNSTTSSSSQQGHFEYDQKTGQMTHVLPDGSRAKVGTGYSGKGDGLNNPDEQYTPNTGPIPQGTYTIEKQRDNVTGAGHKLPGSMRLDPTGDTDTHGRAGFLIHGDNSRGDHSASNGCIILPRPARNEIGGSSDHILVVVP